jgi:hypothetical protein
MSNTRLSDGEINALEYYVANQMLATDSSIGRGYILRAIDELRAIRAAGVLVNQTPAQPAAVAPLHLSACKPPGSEVVVDVRRQEWECPYECPAFQFMRHQEWLASDGKWTCSTSEEHFDCSEVFDTEAEAIEYGAGFASEMGIEDGMLYWTGQISIMRSSELARVFDATRTVETMEEYIYDNCGDEVSYEIRPSTEQDTDLEARVRPVIARWLDDHGLTPSCAHINKVRSHVFHLCPEVDSTRFDPANHPRCTRETGHDGDHEWAE